MYKILVFSDTHRDISRVVRVINNNKDVNCIIHLGDEVADANELERLFDIPIYYIKGNWDLINKSVEDEKVFTLAGKQFFITHGHNYGVSFSKEKIYARAKELGVDIALFGHTHKKYLEYEGDLLIMNPGSISQPRDSRIPTFGIIEIFDDGKISANISENI